MAEGPIVQDFGDVSSDLTSAPLEFGTKTIVEKVAVKNDNETEKITTNEEFSMPFSDKISEYCENSEEENLSAKKDNANTCAKPTEKNSKTPTLVEDSKSVKISLPSNTQFLNKSLNFINFITEKSTNIIEKNLLSQNTASRINLQNGKNEEEKDNLAKFSIDEEEEIPENSGNPESSNSPDENSAGEKCGDFFAEKIRMLEENVEKLKIEAKSNLIMKEKFEKDFLIANKEKESMVMKYAIGEKQLIQVQRSRDAVEQKYKDLMKGYELLQNKLRQGQSERVKICNVLDGKCSELVECQKQLEKMKEDVYIKDSKLKWTQNKLKSEMESHKETQLKLENSMAKINGMTEECDQVRRETQETMRKFQFSEENKAVTLDQQLKEQQARLILERHVTEDKENLNAQLQKEVESLKHSQQVLIEENNSLNSKVEDLESEVETCKNELSQVKALAEERQKEVMDLTAKVSELESCKIQLTQKSQSLSSAEAELARLRLSNEELEADLESCRTRESQTLDFTQKLTDKNVRLQSDFSALEAKTRRLEVEQGPLRERIQEVQGKMRALEASLETERGKHLEECEMLAKKIAEQVQIVENLTRELEDSHGENAVIKRKHQLSLKEMTKELQVCRRKLEAMERASPSHSLDREWRNSNASLNTGENVNGASSDTSNYEDITEQSAKLDRPTLIEHINKLTKTNVERAEKLDFLKEHNRNLVEELQKKTKIIQHYISHGNFDAMGNNEREKNKAELARHGGIMASVYNHKVADENMTLQLSLEINQKLQAVLEDTLLKNITLKDNIETLGEEIEILTMKNRPRN